MLRLDHVESYRGPNRFPAFEPELKRQGFAARGLRVAGKLRR